MGPRRRRAERRAAQAPGWSAAAWASKPGSHVPVPEHHGQSTLTCSPPRVAKTLPVARQAEHGCGPVGGSGAFARAGRRPLGLGVSVESAIGGIVAARDSRRLAVVSYAGRFAPSPSADLHLGNLRTALLAWLGARSQGASFHLRIDDLDTARSRPEIAARQLADLAALGLTHDGPVPWQSQRLPRYAAGFDALLDAGALYPCFCTRAEIRDVSRAPHGHPAGGYPGTCRDLTDAERTAQLAAGRIPAWRLRGDRAPVTFHDRVLGAVERVAEDAVLRRADGAFGYQLAVVLDDADQAIGEVARGADLLDSVATQLQLQRLLQLPRPGYAHLPLMLGPDGARLAKRHGAVTLADAVNGARTIELPGLPPTTPCSPAQLRSALATTVGLAATGEQPTLAQLTDRFSYDALPTTSTIMGKCS